MDKTAKFNIDPGLIIIVLFLIAALIQFCCTGCTKKQDPQYHVTLSITGKANYQYQIGNTKSSGHCTNTTVVFTGIAKPGDLVSVSAQGDSISTPPFRSAVNIKFTCDPLLGSGNVDQTALTPSASHQF